MFRLFQCMIILLYIMYIYIYSIYLYIHVCVHTCIHTYIYIYTCIYLRACACASHHVGQPFKRHIHRSHRPVPVGSRPGFGRPTQPRRPPGRPVPAHLSIRCCPSRLSGGFWGYPQSSSIDRWIFHEIKQLLYYKGVPPSMEPPICSEFFWKKYGPMKWPIRRIYGFYIRVCLVSWVNNSGSKWKKNNRRDEAWGCDLMLESGHEWAEANRSKRLSHRHRCNPSFKNHCRNQLVVDNRWSNPDRTWWTSIVLIFTYIHIFWPLKHKQNNQPVWLLLVRV